MKPSASLFLLAGLSSFLFGCASDPYGPTMSTADNTPQAGAEYKDLQDKDSVSGVGIESQDIATMTDKMVRDMLTNPKLAGAKTPPRVIIDSKFFRNESSTRINKKIITNKIRVGLQRAARERMVFVQRHYEGMLNSNNTESGSTGVKLTQATLPGDYRLGGTIASLDSVNSKTGRLARAHYITFEMVHLDSGEIAWSGQYEFKKEAINNIMYR